MGYEENEELAFSASFISSRSGCSPCAPLLLCSVSDFQMKCPCSSRAEQHSVRPRSNRPTLHQTSSDDLHVLHALNLSYSRVRSHPSQYLRTTTLGHIIIHTRRVERDTNTTRKPREHISAGKGTDVPEAKPRSLCLPFCKEAHGRCRTPPSLGRARPVESKLGNRRAGVDMHGVGSSHDSKGLKYGYGGIGLKIRWSVKQADRQEGDGCYAASSLATLVG